MRNFFETNEAVIKIRKFLVSDAFMAILFIMGLGVMLLNEEIKGTIFFVGIMCFVLLFSDDILALLPPAFIMFSFAIRCKVTAKVNTFDEFMKYSWIIPVIIIVAIINSRIYNKGFHLHKGKLFKPILFAAIATTIGGVGIITVEEYFKPVAILYTLGLGFGILFLYFLFSCALNPNRGSIKDVDIFLSKTMVLVTIFLFVAVLQWYGENWAKFIADPNILPFQWRNNACTMLMIALPFCFYMSTKKFPYIITVFLSYGTMLLSGSRGGLLCGGIELLILIIYFAKIDKKHRNFMIFTVGLVVIFMIAIIPQLMSLFSYTIDRLFSENDIRLGLLKRSVEDFLANPITGRGLGYMGNRDIHKSAVASLCWYHSQIPQVFGSFGLVGVFAYGYQMICRLKLLIGEKALFAKVVLLSFIGLELMSLVNPGIFAMPYIVIITILFIVIENYHFKGGYPEYIPKEMN